MYIAILVIFYIIHTLIRIHSGLDCTLVVGRTISLHGGFLEVCRNLALLFIEGRQVKYFVCVHRAKLKLLKS